MAPFLHPLLTGPTPERADYAAAGRVRMLYQRHGRFPAGSIVPDIGQLVPGDILLFNIASPSAHPVTIYQTVCGYRGTVVA